jgi:stage II sporulation protein AA (anti-sigma F factor antagonist)
MNFKVELKENTRIAEISGELDDHIAKNIREKIDFVLLRKDISNLIFDLSALTLMDSAGIGLLIGRYKLIKQRNGQAIIVIGTSHAKKILKMSGVLNIFKEAESLSEALEMVGQTSIA